MNAGTLSSIWRYPVKSLRGESLERAVVERSGLAGDRTSAYVVASVDHPRYDKTYRGKEEQRLHTLRDDDGVRAVAAQHGLQLQRREGERFFDDAPVSVLFDVWLRDLSEHVGYAVEPERFRPNLFVAASPEFSLEEDSLRGGTLAIGSVLLRVREPIERCVVTTYDPRGGQSDPRILRFVAQQRQTWMGVYCDVLQPGSVQIGDTVTSR
jgi:uncharacterized protein YcbX